jgi:2-C-methyl-D-erythritol 4-phosphate cytidylyltransferase/2-C-methyl-D-erythritol 2,4-cyclodiphosphate synthase
MKKSVIICAAGKGTRAGFSFNKLLAPLYGAPVIYHTIKKFYDAKFDHIVIATSPEDMPEIKAIAERFGATVVEGGKERTDSVINALKVIDDDIVLIHDGARPFVTQKIIDDCVECVEKHGSAICSLPSTDTTVIEKDGRIEAIPDRSHLFTVQTPQGFFTEDIKRAYRMAIERGDKFFTDDSSVYSKYVKPAHLFTGDVCNRKLTYKSDFNRQYVLVNAVKGQAIGVGIDVHAFGKQSNYVTLCGVKIPCDSGLIAHSDGDVAVHAVMDAILSAVGLKDIGHYFPDTDDKYLNADSMVMLEKVVEIALDEGYTPLNLSLTIQAEKPRLAKHIDSMVEKLAKVCKLEKGNVAVSAGTCEKLGFVGEGLGITATAIVLLDKKQ